MTTSRAEVRASSIFIALLRRDMRVARRELPFFLLRTTLQPLMFVVVFGYLLPRMGFMGRGYTTALLPGVLAISLTFSSIQSVALPMVQDFGWTKEIEDRLLAPSRFDSWRRRKSSRVYCRESFPRCLCCRWRGSSWVRFPISPSRTSVTCC